MAGSPNAERYLSRVSKYARRRRRRRQATKGTYNPVDRELHGDSWSRHR